MYLEKLEIQGFKSFAHKNVLFFPGISGKDKRGITAVVGPNGSGKSNVADAVRWSLGEQSMKTLRGKKSEDVIFSGSDKKGQLGMAEVSLHFNNEDRQAPIDYSQVVLTRRLYRNGDSEYLLNNSRVRLFDIQMLLAKASFGQKTYSVIGQGMVEGFLNTSLSERKEFFDEATGVKQYQIKRDDALNKLRVSHENFLQAEMLVAEIEPRMKSLTRQVARLRKRDELEKELDVVRRDYYSYTWNDLTTAYKKANEDYLVLEKEKNSKEKRVDLLESELEAFKKESFRGGDFERLQGELGAVQGRRNVIARDLARIEAQIEIKLEADGHFDLAFMHNKKEEIKASIQEADNEIASLSERIETEKSSQTMVLKERQQIEEKIQILNKQMRGLGRFVEETTPDLHTSLLEISQQIDEMEKTDNLELIRKMMIELKHRIAKAIKATKENGKQELKPNEEWSRLYELMESLNKEREEFVRLQGEKQMVVNQLLERSRLLKEKISDLKKEEQGIETKIRQYSGLSSTAELEESKKKLVLSLTKEDSEIIKLKESLSNLNQAEETKRQKLFSLQKELQSGQSEINALAGRLQTLKIEATRYETRLEDLETEIRAEIGTLAEIKKHPLPESLNVSASKETIRHLKKQLETIGGIDPSVETEYSKTKERYDFLTGQILDLKEAVHSLEKIIKELDIVIREKFDKEFKEIARKFEEYFKILFNGGTARISKVMEAEMTESVENEGNADPKAEEDKLKKIKFLQKHNSSGLAGIEIKATPPGKRINSVAMLSGGERALTSIALICAIISTNPSPFVVLDEVDAALDEANSERLAKILDELSHKTQFIVITHNRASMRKANILYGVTMGDDGVSKLLSVKLDEAVAKAK